MSFRMVLPIFRALPIAPTKSNTFNHSALLTDPNAFFHCAEHSVFTSGNSAVWSITDEEHVLTMSDSGASGCMRFSADTGENFTVTCGVDQGKVWCDIVPNLTLEETTLVIHPSYYNQPDRIAVRESHQTDYTVTTATGLKLSIDFIDDKGHHFLGNIIIG